jgi:hypothetical protein
VTGLHRDAKHFYTWQGDPPVPGITSIIGILDKPALVGWAKRETAIAAIRNWQTVAKMVSDQPPIEDQLAYHPAVAYLKATPGYQRDRAANAGTVVHAIAEAIAKGERPVIPDEYEDFARAFIRDFIEKYKPKFHPLYVEAMVYHTGADVVLPYGGTMDLFCQIGDDIVLLDHKTTKSGVYPETALQLAAGRYAEFIGKPDDDKKYAIPKVDRCAVLWIRPEGAELIPFDVTPREFQAFSAARMAWDWVNIRAKEVKGKA